MTKTRKTSSSTPDRATAYAKAVIAGKIVAGPHVRNACRRHLDDLKHGKKRGLRFDKALADRAGWVRPERLDTLRQDEKGFVLMGSRERNRLQWLGRDE